MRQVSRIAYLCAIAILLLSLPAWPEETVSEPLQAQAAHRPLTTDLQKKVYRVFATNSDASISEGLGVMLVQSDASYLFITASHVVMEDLTEEACAETRKGTFALANKSKLRGSIRIRDSAGTFSKLRFLKCLREYDLALFAPLDSSRIVSETTVSEFAEVSAEMPVLLSRDGPRRTALTRGTVTRFWEAVLFQKRCTPESERARPQPASRVQNLAAVDTLTSFGDSGGPVFALDGKLAGISVSICAQEKTSYFSLAANIQELIR